MTDELRLTLEPEQREQLSRWAEENDVELIFFNPPAHFDHAIVGLVRGYGQEAAVLYDEVKVIQALVADGMTAEDAEEWFTFNTIGAYVGEATPRFLIRPWEEDSMSKKRNPVHGVLKYFEEADLPLAEQALSLASSIVKRRAPTKRAAATRPQPVPKKPAAGGAD
jgi:hypothetical protein